MRRLIIFSDPGGAKPCLALAKEWMKKDEVTVISDREYSFYREFSIPVKVTKKCNPASIIQKYKPDFIFTGTSYTSNLEKKFTFLAIEKGIYSETFVDHITCIRERFELNHKLFFPSKINVTNKRAKRIAIGNGIPEEKIKIIENPYYKYLRKWKPSLSKKEFLEKAKINHLNGRILLYAPDPLSNREGIKRFGTDECQVLDIIISEISRCKCEYIVLIKPHPNQDVDILKKKIKKIIDRNKNYNINIFLVPNILESKTIDTLNYSDLVCGIFSNILLEARIMKKPTVQVLIGLNEEWSIKLGKGIQVVNNKCQLAKVLSKPIGNK